MYQLIIDQLLANKIVLIPTDTIYAAVVNAYSQIAVENLYNLKQRPLEKKFALFIHPEKIKNHVTLNKRNIELIENFIPGEITFILPNIDPQLENLALDNKIGIRAPANEFILKLLFLCDFPLVATSVNISGEVSAVFYDEINPTIKNNEMVFNYNFEKHINIKPSGCGSSIFDLTSEKILMLRKGKISLEEVLYKSS